MDGREMGSGMEGGCDMRQLFCKVEEDQTLQGGGQWEGKHLPIILFLSLPHLLFSLNLPSLSICFPHSC